MIRQKRINSQAEGNPYHAAPRCKGAIRIALLQMSQMPTACFSEASLSGFVGKNSCATQPL